MDIISTSNNNNTILNQNKNTNNVPQVQQKKLKWEEDFSHNWNILKNPNLLSQMEKLTLNSTEETLLTSDIEEKEEIEEIQSQISSKTNFNFNFMRTLIIILDLTQNSDKVDFKPNRHKCLIKKLEVFITEYFKYNMASSIIVISTKDYSSQIISPLSNNPSMIIANIIKGTQSSSGNFSLTNSFRVSLDCIISNKMLNNDILLLSSSPITYDRDNIYEIIAMFNLFKVEVNILTLETPYELIKTVAQMTNGTFIHAKNESDIDQYLSDIIYKKTNKEVFKIALAGVQMSDDKLLCSCHQKLVSLAYICQNCNLFFCTLPYFCRHCETLIVNMAIVYQLKKGNANMVKKNIFNSVCKPFKLYKYYAESMNDNPFLEFVERINSLLYSMHSKEFIKETKCKDKDKCGYQNCAINYQIKILTVYLKYKSKYLLHNASKNIRSTNETDLISETKLFLLKDNLRCAGCNENIEITDTNGLKNVFIFDKCLDCYCEKCYRYIIENDIGCISCYE